MNLELLSALKAKHINAIKLNIVRINNTEYVFLKFMLIIFIGSGLILSIFLMVLCIFSHGETINVRFYMGLGFLISFSNSVILYVVYAILFEHTK